MKKKLVVWTLLMLCFLNGCGKSVVQTMEPTPEDQVAAVMESGRLVTLTRYSKLRDGTWKTDTHSYQYCLELTGRMHGASLDSTYVILSNRSDITFEQAWKASGLSSNLSDYFQPEEAKIVAIGVG